MKISKFIKVDKDVLLEWIYDDSNYLTEDYRIIIDTLTNTISYSNNEESNKQVSVTKNTSENQLFSLDENIHKWGIVDTDPDTNKYLFLQYKNFSGNVPFRYDRVKLHFPVNYTFKNNMGFLLNINLINESQTLSFPISNYFYDKTDANRSDMDLTTTPFIFNEVLWGKHIEILVPSPYALINDVTINNGVRIPRTGTIHYNLIGANTLNVLSNQAPIFIDFQFLTQKNVVLEKVSYIASEPFRTTVSAIPEYENLGVSIQSSKQGDYFEIFGTFNGDISEFNTFISNSTLMGKSYYVIYNITTYEKNIQSGFLTISQSENFDIPVDFRPIIKYSNTTAIIDVNMQLINSIDNSIITRTSTYAMLQNDVAKYSRFLTKIDVRNTYTPKIYNAKPDILNIQSTNNNIASATTTINHAVVYERINVSVKVVSDTINTTTYDGQGQGQILLHPTNNIFKFAVISSISGTGIIPFTFPTESPIYLRFKSSDTVIDTPMYYDTNEVDLKNGILVFNILETNYDTLKKMYKNGYDKFYIITKSDTGINTTIYMGTFLPSN